MRKPLIAGNWKMNGSRDRVATLLDVIVSQAIAIPDVEFAVFPPAVYLADVVNHLVSTPVRWGVQTASEYSNGAFTGEISVEMLRDFGCTYAILGHSERRQYFNETDKLIAEKAQAVVAGGLQPIICVGETLAQREANETMMVIKEQLAHVLSLKDNLPAVTSIVFAYEPVWAIGTGKTATPAQADDVHRFIREMCEATLAGWGETVRVIYGGSVKPANAAALFEMPNIDGALVGGASLDGHQFIDIGRQWNKS